MEMARAIGWAELIHRRQVELVRLIYSIVGGKSSQAKSATCPGCSRVINPRSSDFPREEARSHKKPLKRYQIEAGPPIRVQLYTKHLIKH